ncbi:MAG: carboxylate--amine ligase [Sphingomonadaceae bacterium]|nr:carboxylate--amine ligase [Sphingomonadaceae bacterium]
MPSNRPVAVLGADSPIGLTVIRELGEHGVRVLALGKSRDSIGRFSHHAALFETIEMPLAHWLPGLIERHRPFAIMAISEHHLIELAALKGKLGDCLVLCPDADRLDIVLDKRRTLEIAAQAGLDVPQSWQPLAGDDLTAKAASLDFPVAIKWPDPNRVAHKLEQQGIALEKVEYASKAAELLAILSRYAPLGEYPLVQGWCAGEGFGQMLHMKNGRATLTFQHRRLREWPPSGGVSSFCEAAAPALHHDQMDLSEKLLRQIGWEGPAMVEYRHDPATGKYWLMEVNGRFWGSIPLAYHCGAQFGWEYLRCHALGESGKAAKPYRRRRARYAIPDFKHLIAILGNTDLPVTGRLRFALRFLADFLDPRVRYYVWSLRDPMPMLGDFISIVRRRLR